MWLTQDMDANDQWEATPAGRVRRAGCRLLFGPEMETARRAHWVSQWHSTSRIQEDQWRLVCDCVTHAWRTSPFYQIRLDSLGRDGALTLDAFRRIPPLARQDVIASWASIRTAGPASGMVRRQSGGSRGPRVEIPLDRATYCWYVAGMWRGLRWWGSYFTDRGAIVLGSSAGRIQRLLVRVKDWATNWLRLPVDGGFDGRAATMLDQMARFAPAFIYGYPSAVHRLARAVQERGWRPRKSLKVIVLTGEPVYAFQRRAIEHAFRCPVVEEYGNGELGSMAFQCPEGALHITAENVFLEAMPPEPPAAGVGGRILVTQLRNRRFPLIRYETGDMGVVSAEPCRCGRGLPTVQVHGRLEDQLVGREGSAPAHPKVEAFHEALPEPLRGRVQVVHPSAEQLVLRVERLTDAPAALDTAAAAARGVVGQGWTLDAVFVERLPRLSSGKLPYFVRTARP